MISLFPHARTKHHLTSLYYRLLLLSTQYLMQEQGSAAGGGSGHGPGRGGGEGGGGRAAAAATLATPARLMEVVRQADKLERQVVIYNLALLLAHSRCEPHRLHPANLSYMPNSIHVERLLAEIDAMNASSK